MRLAVLALLGPATLLAGTAADLAKSIREITFDRNECYRVRDITLEKQDIRVYLTEGHLIFSKPVAGRPIAALFTADGDSGDGEVILLPPDRAERRSLAVFTHAPNLDDHFTAAVFLFTGSAYQDLRDGLAGNPSNKKTPEVGALMDEQYGSVLRNLASSYQTRITFDLLGRPGATPDLFAAVFNSSKLGNYDIVYDPYGAEQIVAGQVISKERRVYFDDWTRFADRDSRRQEASGKPPVVLDVDDSDYRIDAEIHPDLSMSAVTRFKARPRQGPLPAVRFEIAPSIKITSASIDGQPAEVLQTESMLSNFGSNANSVFLVVPPQPLAAGRDYEVEIHHEGKVILDAGDGVYYVASRGAWYPFHGLQFSTFDLTFHYPRGFQLVAPGDVVDDRTEGEIRTTRRRTANAIRVAAFNYGDFAHVSLDRGPYSIEVFANRKLEAALQPRPQPILTNPAPPTRRRGVDPLTVAPPAPPQPNPMGRLQALAAQVGSALDFMSAKFGPPALPHIAVSPIPGTFGQGFPGLIYLSTLSYLTGEPMGKTANMFYDEVLAAHEVAHQWWGNRVTAESYRDNWLMEALANYSALLYLEKTKGPRAMDEMLETYRTELLQKNDAGETKESAGPIVLGPRLQSSVQPSAWTAITYGKGSWIIHMLRRRMGDERFFALLGGLIKRYDHRSLSTEQFRLEAAAALPPKSDDSKLEGFFAQWVYGTGIPTLKLSYTLKGAAPNVKLTGTLTQTGVDDDFSALVPIEIRFAKGPGVVKWVASASDPETFTVALRQAPSKVTMDPKNGVLKK